MAGAEIGTAFITRGDEGLSGEISAGSQSYRIGQKGGDLFTVTETDLRALPEEAPTMETEPKRAKPRTQLLEQQTTTNVQIDVLFMYTQGLLDRLKAESTTIDQYFQRRNQEASLVYGLNGRNKLGYTIRLLGPVKYEGKTSGSVVTQRNLLSSDGRDKEGTTRKARDARGADLVALVMAGSSTDYCGSGSFYVNGQSWRAFSVSRFGCEGRYTFAHEIGHNLGADHARSDYKNPGANRCNFGFKSQAARKVTIMAYLRDCANCRRQPYFSDTGIQEPTKTGQVTMGIACNQSNRASNIASVRAHGSTVASYRASK
jgi:hypothetical protein